MKSISDYSATIGTPAIASALPRPAASSQDSGVRAPVKAVEHPEEPAAGAVFSPYGTELRVPPVADSAEARFGDSGAWMVPVLLAVVGMAAVFRLGKKYLG